MPLFVLRKDGLTAASQLDLLEAKHSPSRLSPMAQVEEEDRKFLPPGCGPLANSYNLPSHVLVSIVS